MDGCCLLFALCYNRNNLIFTNNKKQDIFKAYARLEVMYANRYYLLFTIW